MTTRGPLPRPPSMAPVEVPDVEVVAEAPGFLDNASEGIGMLERGVQLGERVIGVFERLADAYTSRVRAAPPPEAGPPSPTTPEYVQTKAGLIATSDLGAGGVQPPPVAERPASTPIEFAASPVEQANVAAGPAQDSPAAHFAPPGGDVGLTSEKVEWLYDEVRRYFEAHPDLTGAQVAETIRKHRGMVDDALRFLDDHADMSGADAATMMTNERGTLLGLALMKLAL